MKSRPLLARFSSLLGVTIGIAGVAFVAKTLVSKWDEVSNAFSQVDAINLVLSLLLGLAAMTSIGWIWVAMIIARSHNVRHRNAMSWYFTGQLGKYVPGGIWPIVGRAELAVRNGIPRRDAYASTGLSLVTTYAAAVVAIGIGAASTSGHRLIAVLIALGLITVYIAFAQPSLRTVIIRIASRVSSSASSLTDPKRLARLTLMHVPAWLLMSLSTSVTATAFGAHIGIADMLFITTTSWLAGFVVVGVPGGIGVREAVFTSLAGGIIGTPMAVSLALMSRVVFIAVDLTGTLVSSVISRTNKSVKT
ncbi:MAG: lysylphosphatidylglycerol synthase domain-containing protein [Actinomycetota bacterium]